MSAPVHKLKKSEIVSLANGHCKAHGHNYLDHYACYRKDHPLEKPERIGYLDLETSNLAADYGQLLSWAIKPSDSKTVIGDVFKPSDIKSGTEDKRIVASCVKEMLKYDRIVTFYGSMFDIPFLRARAMIVGVPFPPFGSLKHRDCYFIMKSRFKLSSKRLENCCRQLLGATEKTRIDAVYWRNGTRGDKKALAYIYDHNCKDVTDLEKLYNKVEMYSKLNDTSV